MEKAILKTLIYSDIFSYPLTLREIHKWLIGRKVELRRIEKALKKLNQESRIKNQGEFNFLVRHQKIVGIRLRKKKYSYIYIRKAKLVAFFLKAIPWIKLVGMSGGLAMENASKIDDIDLFIITSKDRLWLARLLTLFVLSLIGQRRKVGDTKRESAGKICPNIFLGEDQLEQRKKDLYTAHEVLQMRVLWERDGVYTKYLEDNNWAFKFLPNWVGGSSRQPHSLARERRPAANRLGYTRFARLRTCFARPCDLLSQVLGLAAFGGNLLTLLENNSKKLQLKIMKKPTGMERIEEGALYFHPDDYSGRINSEYQKKLRRAGLT